MAKEVDAYDDPVPPDALNVTVELLVLREWYILRSCSVFSFHCFTGVYSGRYQMLFDHAASQKLQLLIKQAMVGKISLVIVRSLRLDEGTIPGSFLQA